MAEDATSRAVSAAEAGDFATAVQCFQKAINDAPPPDTAAAAALHEQLAQCLMELEQWPDATQAAERATALAPSWAVAWLTYARALLNAGHPQDAQCACIKCLELDPDNDEAAQDLADINTLLQQQTSRLIGLPGLSVATDPMGRTGPGCVIWQAGLALAKVFVQLAAMQQEQCQPGAQCQVPSHQHQGATCALGTQLSATSQLQQLPRLQGSCVLELGSGTGVVGITAAACGAHVVLTDLPQALGLLQANIARNRQLIETSGGSARHAVLDWAANKQPVGVQLQEALGDQHQASWDWGCGADLVFNAPQVAPVVDAVKQFLLFGGGERRPDCFVMAHKQRHAEVDALLVEALEAAGCSVMQRVQVGWQQDDEGEDQDKTSCAVLLLIIRLASSPPLHAV